MLPAGSAVVFIADGHLDLGAKRGSTVRLHLRDDLLLDGTVVAAAGTPARLALGGTTTVGGTRLALISIEDFSSKYGLLPVRPVSATIAAIDQGTPIAAKTVARVDHLDGRFSIEVPFPFTLSKDAPISTYTATPAKTAPPRGTVGPGPVHTPIVRGTPPAPPATAVPLPSQTR